MKNTASGSTKPRTKASVSPISESDGMYVVQRPDAVDRLREVAKTRRFVTYDQADAYRLGAADALNLLDQK